MPIGKEVYARFDAECRSMKWLPRLSMVPSPAGELTPTSLTTSLLPRWQFSLSGSRLIARIALPRAGSHDCICGPVIFDQFPFNFASVSVGDMPETVRGHRLGKGGMSYGGYTRRAERTTWTEQRTTWTEHSVRR